jgi:hypothetical protein
MEAPRGLSVRVQGPQLLVEAEDGVQAQWTALVPLREARAFGDLVACLDVRGAVALFRLERAPSHQGEP